MITLFVEKTSMVPYSQISISDQISIINNYLNDLPQESVMNSTPSIDESYFRHVIRAYRKYWHEKLLSERISLTPVYQLIKSCFAHFSYQFMHIKNTVNILLLNTTYPYTTFAQFLLILKKKQRRTLKWIRKRRMQSL